MKKLIIWILVLAMLALSGAYFIKSSGSKEEAEEQKVSAYFYDRMIELAIKDIGMAIEGFDANLLMEAYPGLKANDFEGVETPEGVYEVREGTPVFVRSEAQPITSAERMISQEGYATLLKNISRRTGMPAETEAQVDNIIEKINTAERVKAAIGERASALGFEVAPTELLEDSRCPIDVQCIQAGTVRVRASTLSATGQGSKIFDLNKPVLMDKWEVTLVQVDPAPEVGKVIGDKEYLFYFKISTRVN